MPSWRDQFDNLIVPAIARSTATKDVLIDHGVLGRTGELVARYSESRSALVMADEAGFAAAGQGVVAGLRDAGFEVRTNIKPVDPLPKASVEEAEPFRTALSEDPDLFPVSVGSGVINDLAKYAAFETGRRYVTVATAASMDGYTSAGAPLSSGGFKVTIPTRAPVALIADLDVIAAAPAEMNGWGYADLAGKSPAGGDWILAELAGAEQIDGDAFPMVQDHLRGWLDGPAGIAEGDAETVARLFVGLTAVGFAMEFHGSSRPASGADHQIAHMWEMEGLTHHGKKVSHGAAVAVGCLTSLALFDWLIAQDLSALDIGAVVEAAPDLDRRLSVLETRIADPEVARRSREEVSAKHAMPGEHRARLERIKAGWEETRARLRTHLYRYDEMAGMLRSAGAPASITEIGVSQAHFAATVRAAPFIRRRYTIFDFLHETGLWETALDAILPRPSAARGSAA